MLVFSDPHWVLVKDRVDELGEQRLHALGRVFLQPEKAALLLVVHVYREEEQSGEEIIRIISARKLISVSAESISKKPLTKKQRAVLTRIADRQAAGDDSGINYRDIPPLSEEQLANAFRPREKQLIAVRLDRDVLDWLKSYGDGYSTRLNGILRAVMEQKRPRR